MTESTMSATVVPDNIRKALFILRVTLGVFLLQWGIEKFVKTEWSISINESFYQGIIPMDQTIAFVFGGAECLIAIAIIVGFQKRWSYLLGFLIHAVSTVSTIPHLIDPWGDGNHLFMTGVPVLAAFWLIFQARKHDTFLAVDDR